ncbi:MAG: hypothetical protein ACLR0P_06160 [Oscillospiraceae bacterium]
MPLGSIAPAGDEKIGGGQAAELPLLVGGEEASRREARPPPRRASWRTDPRAAWSWSMSASSWGTYRAEPSPRQEGAGAVCAGERSAGSAGWMGLRAWSGMTRLQTRAKTSGSKGRSERPRSDSC